MSYIGNTPTSQSFISGTDYFNGNGSTTAFTLTRTVGSVNDIEAVVENVVQRPNDAYTLSGTTITFTSAPPSGTNNVYVRYLSTTTQSITPVQNSVSYSTMNTDLQNQWGTGFKNRIINGDMRIDQRNAGASLTVANTGAYSIDRWRISNAVSTVTAQQSTTAPTGFNNSLLITVTSADSNPPSSGTSHAIQYYIEGTNVADLGFGSASAKTITLSFWVRSSLTGTYGIQIGNNAPATRAYVAQYTINSANTFEYKTITISGDTTGTWATNTGIGVSVVFDLGSGSSFEAASANTWTTSDNRRISGNALFASTASATFYITGVQLEVGSTATPFEVRPYGAELIMCQRYYTSGNTYYQSTVYNFRSFPVTMRAAPTLTSSVTLSDPLTYVDGFRSWLGATQAATFTASIEL